MRNSLFMSFLKVAGLLTLAIFFTILIVLGVLYYPKATILTLLLFIWVSLSLLHHRLFK